MNLTTSEKIRLITKRKNMSIGQLADKLETSRQNFSNKVIRDDWRESDLQEIAKALDCELIVEFDPKK